jgi:glutamate transport system ATP-binding protein
METTGAGVRDTGSTLTGVPMVSIKGVNKHFGDLHVLKDINLDVESARAHRLGHDSDRR